MGGVKEDGADLAPDTVRDSSFLITSDLIVIILGIGTQAILTRGLEQEAYGRWVIVIDLLRTIFLLSELGLPPLMLRELPQNHGIASRLMSRTLRIQMFALLFLLVPVHLLMTLFILPPGDSAWAVSGIILIGALGLAVLSYGQRCGLRALGRANVEAISKIIPAVIMVIGCAIVSFALSDPLQGFAFVMLVSTSSGFIIARIGLNHRLKSIESNVDGGTIPSSWTLIKWAAPFLLAVALIPLASRVDKFVLAGLGPNAYVDVAIYNIAQMVFFAALVAPSALRGALVPVLSGYSANDPSRGREVASVMTYVVWLIPFGLILGFGVIHLALPVIFPQEYTNPNDSTMRGAVFVATAMLPAWGLAMLSAPWIAEVQAGENGWMFSVIFGVGLLVNTIGSLALVPWLGVMGAVWSTIMMHVGLLITAVGISRSSGRDIPLTPLIMVGGAMCLLTGLFILASTDTLQHSTLLAVSLLIALALWAGGWRPFPPSGLREFFKRGSQAESSSEEA